MLIPLEMQLKSCVIGVDSSTTSTKVVAFDRHGRVLAEESAGYDCTTPRQGWVEQESSDWWASFASACRVVTETLSRDSCSIEGIAFTHQRFSFVPVDDSFRPLRKAILWNDLRCEAEAENVRQTIGIDRVYRATGYPPGQWTLYKVLWLMNHEPELYRRIRKILLVSDALVFALTGELSTTQSSAAMTGALDIHTPSKWNRSLISQLNIREDIWVDSILPAGALSGKVTSSAAVETGLPAGTPVFAGAGDQPCGTLGSGILHAGQLGINGGTSCSCELVCDALPPLKRPDFFVEINPAGGYIAENDIPSGASAVAGWYRREWGRPIDDWDAIYGSLSDTPTGCDGLLIVPYLQGVYGPYWSQNARGVVLGLRTDHTKEHVIRALLEGVAYESRREVDLICRGIGTKVEEIRMYGGSAQSDYWNQIFADMHRTVVHVPSGKEATALGAAICASVGCGMHSSWNTAVSSMTSIDRSYEPRASHADVYDRYYQKVYSKSYDRVADITEEISAIHKEIEL